MVSNSTEQLSFDIVYRIREPCVQGKDSGQPHELPFC